MARVRRRCASSSCPTPRTGSTSTTSTACASTPRSRCSTPPRSTCSPPSRGPRARPPASARCCWWRRTSRSRSGCSVRPNAAATASTRCGTTTFITPHARRSRVGARPTTATTPADHNAELARLVRKGRVEFLQQFPSIATADVTAALADPGDRATFERCKLDFAERERHAEAYALHCDLLRLRREDPTFAAQGARGVDGAVLGDNAFVLRFFGERDDDRLMLVNLGVDLVLDILPEPLLAPPEDRRWTLLWSSEHPRYGGGGAVAPATAGAWTVPGHAALVLRPDPIAT